MSGRPRDQWEWRDAVFSSSISAAAKAVVACIGDGMNWSAGRSGNNSHPGHARLLNTFRDVGARTLSRHIHSGVEAELLVVEAGPSPGCATAYGAALPAVTCARPGRRQQPSSRARTVATGGVRTVATGGVRTVAKLGAERSPFLSDASELVLSSERTSSSPSSVDDGQSAGGGEADDNRRRALALLGQRPWWPARVAISVGAVKTAIDKQLGAGWSPEQIAAQVKSRGQLPADGSPIAVLISRINDLPDLADVRAAPAVERPVPRWQEPTPEEIRKGPEPTPEQELAMQKALDAFDARTAAAAQAAREELQKAKAARSTAPPSVEETAPAAAQ